VRQGEIPDTKEAFQVILVCTKCETSNRIEREGNDLHCKFCGNVVVEGVTPRWPIVEKEVFDTMKKKCRKCNKKNALVDGLCYACYKEEHGHAYIPEKPRGDQKREKKEKKTEATEKKTPAPPAGPVFDALPDDLPVYGERDFRNHLQFLIDETQKRLDALRLVLDMTDEAA